MFQKKHTGRIVNLFINIFLGVALVLVALLLADSLQPMLFFQNVIISICVGYTLCDLIPAAAWGEHLVKRLKIRNRFFSYLLSSAVSGLIFITAISFTCQFVAFGSDVFHIWPHALPYLLLTGYLVLLCFMPVCQKAAALLTKQR